MKKFLQFIFAVVVSFIPGLIGIMFTPRGGADVWYNALEKSVLTPDGWVFGVAWTILYLLLGIALYLIIRARPMRNDSKTPAYMLFVAQMALNALWSYMFFGLHMVLGGLIVLVALIFVSVWMMRTFYPISRPASYLVWPYIIWMLFALYLNGMIWYLN